MKMDFLTVFSYFIVLLLTVNAEEYVPVLVWESPSPGGKEASASALLKMSSEEFSDVLARRVDRQPVVVLFAEQTLSVEDFSRLHSGAQGLYPSLKSITEETGLQFIPAVEKPASAVSELDYEWVEVTDAGTLPEAGKKGLVVNLDDAKPGENRSDMLARHDKLVSSFYRRMLEKYPRVLAIYTGRKPSWTAPNESLSRSRREAETAKPSSGTTLVSSGPNDKIMLFTSTNPILMINNTLHNLTSGQTFAPDARKGTIRMPVMYKLDDTAQKINFRFKFNISDDGAWRLTQAEFDDSQNQKVVLETTSLVSANLGSSYSCGSETVFRNANGTVSLKFRNLKVQPLVTSTSFGASTDCVPYFTIGIWSGLLVSFLLLFIVGWGIDMMMNIHTMDRFDDPKGKPLVFNAQE